LQLNAEELNGEEATLEDIQNEAAAKQRAYESQQANTSTSSMTTERGK
jgi:hypothetical protein